MNDKRQEMKKQIIAAFAAIFLLCGCSDKDISETVTETASQTTQTAVTTESVTVTFAKTEPVEEKVTETEAVQTEKRELKENQLEYRDNNISVLMEFTGAESLEYYPHAVKLQKYNEDDYVLHSVFTVENLSYQSFDFIPQKMLINGRKDDRMYVMQPLTENDTGLIASDKYYTIAPDESVSIEIDFVGEKPCIEYANEIRYEPQMHFYTNNINAEELNNVELAAGFDVTKRTAVKKAVRKALEITDNEPLPFKFLPSDGDLVFNTDNFSYCLTAEKVRPDGYVVDYIMITLKIACLTGKAETFEPNMFRLVRSDGKDDMPIHWNFDEELVSTPKEEDVITVNGEQITLYGYPFDLYLHSDGTAEYVMFFRCDEGEEYTRFKYDGKKEKFDEEIAIK